MGRALKISIAEYQRLVALGRIQADPALEGVQDKTSFAHPWAGKSTAGKRADLGGQFFRSQILSKP